MLKAIVAKVDRAAANVGRVGCALAEDIRGDARAASLVAVKKAVGAAFCGVAMAVFLAPASLLAVSDAAAQTQSPTCNDQNRVGGANTTGCGNCLAGYQEFGSQCEIPISCPITGQKPDDSNTTCACEEDQFPIAGACEVPATFCAAQSLTLRENFGTLQNADNPTTEEAEVAYCRQCPQGDDFEKFAGKCQVVKDCSVVVGDGFASGQYRGQFVDRANQNNACVCPNGQEILPDPDNFLLRAKELSEGPADLGAKVCTPALPGYAADGHYTRADCEAAGWDVTYGAVTLAAQGQEPQGGFHLVESCGIPVQFYADAVLTVLSTLTGEQEIRTIGDPTDSASSCVLQHNRGASSLEDAVGAKNIRFCHDTALFSMAGLPMQPGGFNPLSDSLQVVATMTTNIRISFENQQVPLAGAAPVIPDPNTGTVTSTVTGGGGGGGSSGGGGGGGAGPAAGGGILLLALAYYAFSGHDSGASFALTPQASYAIENDLESYSYGSRLEFRQDEWTLWWAADEKSSNGGGKSLNYGYGGQWSNDVLRASAGVNYGESSADMRAGLEAEWTLFNWTIRPAYRFNAVSDEGEWDVKNGLDLTAKMIQAGWTVRPSVNAGLWSGSALDADLGLQVGREF